MPLEISIPIVEKLYVTGGIMSSQVDVIDVSSGETSRGPSMHQPREGHAAAASPTSLFVFGGDETKKSCEVFNLQTNQ